jgi:hypothetical protein
VPLVVAAAMVGQVLVPSAGTALSCGPPTVQEVVAGTTDGGRPIKETWALVRIVGVLERAVGGVTIEATVETVLRQSGELTPSTLRLQATKDPFGSEIPMSHAVAGELWLVPLVPRRESPWYSINICSGAQRPSQSELRDIPGREAAEARPDSPASRRQSGSQAPLAVVGGVGVILLLCIGAALAARSRGRT